MFLLKKVAGQLLMPYSLALLLLLLGLVLLWFTRRQVLGKLAVTGGVMVLVFSGFGVFADRWVSPLESAHSPLLEVGRIGGVRWVVVLGSGHVSDPSLPSSSQPDPAALARLIEGIRLHRQLAGSRLVVSGWQGADPVPHADVMARLALDLGVGERAIVRLPEPRDTAQEAGAVKRLVGAEPIILVTSASHMPRALALFKAAGVEATPAPTEHLAKQRQGWSVGQLFPSAGNLRKTERAWYEYLGYLWGVVLGREQTGPAGG